MNNDEWIVDEETGEILGLRSGVVEAFHVTDRASAEWVLEKMSIVHHDIDAIVKRQQCLIDNMIKQEHELRRRENWLEMRFGPELRAWAETQITGKKKSITLDFGTLGFRQKPGSVTVRNQPAALMWAQDHCEQAIHTKHEIKVSLIPDQLRGNLPVEAFDVTPPSNAFYIKP